MLNPLKTIQWGKYKIRNSDMQSKLQRKRVTSTWLWIWKTSNISSCCSKFSCSVCKNREKKTPNHEHIDESIPIFPEWNCILLIVCRQYRRSKFVKLIWQSQIRVSGNQLQQTRSAFNKVWWFANGVFVGWINLNLMFVHICKVNLLRISSSSDEKTVLFWTT